MSTPVKKANRSTLSSILPAPADSATGENSGSGVPPLAPLPLRQDKRRDAASTVSPEQIIWLRLIRDHIATSLSIDPEDLELSPFNQRGGLGKAHQLFGEQLPKLLDELNQVLAA